MLRHRAFEKGFVALHLRIVFEFCTEFGEDSGDVCVGGLSQAIVSPFAIAACGDESGAAQIGEVSRDLGLVGSQDFHARADAEFVVAEQVYEPQARWIGECLEQDVETVVHSES